MSFNLSFYEISQDVLPKVSVSILLQLTGNIVGNVASVAAAGCVKLALATNGIFSSSNRETFY